ncbi:hypothetical protein RFI_00564 [Reticulomyxa filosa]|uniref:Uncharacterized protein n=1 Tax=Reticulomyxa filosa TaxID=46433 RepID=X6PFP0_RETFI|nr:hypothetical protein RFI_00564 [Reticulomyxa filosa]|eukprot:ETO36497.1 hypothetical protein RFI_00564 [Reticulomyxa filosa]
MTDIISLERLCLCWDKNIEVATCKSDKEKILHRVAYTQHLLCPENMTHRTLQKSLLSFVNEDVVARIDSVAARFANGKDNDSFSLEELHKYFSITQSILACQKLHKIKSSSHHVTKSKRMIEKRNSGAAFSINLLLKCGSILNNEDKEQKRLDYVKSFQPTKPNKENTDEQHHDSNNSNDNNKNHLIEDKRIKGHIGTRHSVPSKKYDKSVRITNKQLQTNTDSKLSKLCSILGVSVNDYLCIEQKIIQQLIAFQLLLKCPATATTRNNTDRFLTVEIPDPVNNPQHVSISVGENEPVVVFNT